MKNSRCPDVRERAVWVPDLCSGPAVQFYMSYWQTPGDDHPTVAPALAGTRSRTRKEYLMAGLADLFSKSSADVGFRAGTLDAWNSTTGANTVTIGGGTLTNLPVLRTTGFPTLADGDVIHLLRVRNQYVILGRIVQPPI